MPTENSTIILTQALVSLPSVTPNDGGCQALIAARLKAIGFDIQLLPFGQVSNIWAKRGTNLPLLVFAGHTDVVPAGPLSNWKTPPFTPHIRDGFLYGRGVADMKGGLAAMVVACEKFVATHPDHIGSIAFLITSDEEGPAQEGTRKVVDYLRDKGETITWCIVGEPSAQEKVGDKIKIGRRGSLNCKLNIYGKQGHIAYPQLAENPIHLCLAFLNTLCQEQWDSGHPQFPNTCLQISNINAGTGFTNVIPDHIEINFNFRYSPAVTANHLKERVINLLKQYGLRYDIIWSHTGEPFLTHSDVLLKVTRDTIKNICGIEPVLSTDGGTSDGRFIAPLGCEIVELGPSSATIHQDNECVSLTDLLQLTNLYSAILAQLLSKNNHEGDRKNS